MTDDQLYSLARHLAGRYRIPGMTADDVTQEAVYHMLRLTGKYDPEKHKCSLRAFLKGRVGPVLLQLARKAYEDPVIYPDTDGETPSGFDDEDDQPTPPQVSEAAELFGRLARLLTRKQFVVACTLADFEADTTDEEREWFRGLSDQSLYNYRKTIKTKCMELGI